MEYVDGSEVAKHNNRRSCWLVIDSNVYDVSDFLLKHPGGASIILKLAGTDATTEFKKYHPLNHLKDYLRPDALIGPLNANTIDQLRQPRNDKLKPGSGPQNEAKRPNISLCVLTTDFEKAAKLVLPRKSWVYASTSANTGLSIKSNLDDWSRIAFRPRVMRDVGIVDTSRRILGQPSPNPFYISPMGTMGVIHAGAEPEMIKGAVRKGVHAVISTGSTKTSENIMRSYQNEQENRNGASSTRLFYQFYMPVNRKRAIELIGIAKGCGYKGLWITVDTAVLGKRTADRYLQAEEALEVGIDDVTGAEWEVGPDNAFAPAMGGRVVQGQLSPHTTWDDLEWIRKEWEGPIVLKGIQCAEDAGLALKYGCDGILLSNHGGRQLHSAPSALMTLLEIRTYCPEVLQKLEVFVDGGLRDGSDVLKALCLGATSVGVGRPFLHALAAYGSKGVEKCVDVLADELHIGMQLLGITSLNQCKPEMVNTSRLLNEMWRPEQLNVKSKL